MISYLGDFAEDATVYIMFNTFSSDDPSASCTITNFINTDVHIHKDDGLTQRNNAAGITVSVDFDGITGSHMVKIDTSDNTVAGFWVVGHEYFVRIEGTTIDGATINSVVGQFSIENRHNEVDVVKISGDSTAANNAELAFDGTGFGFTGCTIPTVTTLTGHTAQTGDSFARLGAPTAASIAADLLAIDNFVDELETRLSAARAGYLDNLSSGAVALASGVDLTSIHGAALTETVNGYLAAAFVKLFDVATPLLVASEVMRGTDNAALASALTTHDGKLDTVDTVVDGIQTDLDNATDGLGALKALIDTIDGIVDNILSDTNELQIDWVNGGRLDLILDTIAADTTTDIPATISTMQGNVTNILADTNELQGDWVDGGRLDLLLDACALEATVAALNNISISDVNNQVIDVLKTDTTSEMVQGALPASPTIEEMIAYLYFKMRNKQETTATEDAIYDDTGAVKLFKSSISDDNITFTKGKYTSGA